MTYTALVPVKALSAAKSRLAPHLSRQQRETLVLDMLRHVLRVLLDSRLFERISVVSPDILVLEWAQAWGAWPLVEEQHDHNSALHAAALREQAAGVSAILTISADLPLLRVSDIQAMVEQSKHYQVVLAPSQDGTGTNAMLVHPPLALPYLFGANSLQRYLQAARQWKLSNITYNSIGLALDIDTIEDLYRSREVTGRMAGEIKLISLTL
jgi:2-phospho-L-lactate guanylyltransferase